jgi:hypothetical protein
MTDESDLPEPKVVDDLPKMIEVHVEAVTARRRMRATAIAEEVGHYDVESVKSVIFEDLGEGEPRVA